MDKVWTKEDILHLRKQMGLTIEQFAQEVEITTSQVWKWEKGLAHPSHLAVKSLNALYERVNKGGQK